MSTKPRARDLGIPLEGTPGQHNAITDVDGVEVGLTTLIEGEACRTGVTVIHPRGRHIHDPVFAGWFPFNGNGEMTGVAWVEEGGFLEGPIGVTNTHNVGVVRDAIIHWQAENDALFQPWSCPVVAETADRVIVMYAGRKVEEAAVDELFAHPLHPYTRGLMSSIPRLALMRREAATAGRLQEIPGIVPALTNLPAGCTFAPRCAFASDICRREYPRYEEKRDGHRAACWHSDRLAGAANG